MWRPPNGIWPFVSAVSGCASECVSAGDGTRRCVNKCAEIRCDNKVGTNHNETWDAAETVREWGISSFRWSLRADPEKRQRYRISAMKEIRYRCRISIIAEMMESDASRFTRCNRRVRFPNASAKSVRERMPGRVFLFFSSSFWCNKTVFVFYFHLGNFKLRTSFGLPIWCGKLSGATEYGKWLKKPR